MVRSMNQKTRRIVGQLAVCLFLTICTCTVHGEERPLKKNLQTAADKTNNAVIPTTKLENDFYDWYQRHDQVKQAIKGKRVDLIFIGDSITHMFGGQPQSNKSRGKDVWDDYYGHRFVVNMGFGWDRTQNVLWRLTHGELEGISPKVAVLLIGTNNLSGTKNARENTPAEIADGVRAVCQTLHKRVPKCKILLLAVLPRSPAKFVKPIQQINQLISELDKQDYITFLNMWNQLADKDGLPRKELMNDTVHPNSAGYRVWAKTMESVLSELLQDKPVAPNKP